MNDEHLIECVRKYPVLYDLSDRQYMNMELKNLTWMKVGEELEITGSTCKSRWNNIRDNYKRALRKSKTRSGQKAQATKPYKYAQQLGFLNKYFVERETLSNVTTEAIEEDVAVPRAEILLDDGAPEEDSFLLHRQASTNIRPPCRLSSDNITPLLKRRKVAAAARVPSTTVAGTVMDYLVQKENNSTPAHPVDTFLAGIASVLKLMTPEQFFHAKGDIFETVRRHERKLYCDQQPHAHEQNNIYSTSSCSDDPEQSFSM